MAKLIKPLQLIFTEEKLVGNGKDDPLRRVRQYFTTDGILVLEYDPHTTETSMTANLLKVLEKLDEKN